MPIVRQYQQQVTEAPIPTIRVPTSAPANAFTSPLGELAPVATQVSAQRDALTRKAEADADEMVGNEAEHKAVLASLDILQNPETGALNKQGTNALKALPAAQEAWRTVTSDIAGTLTTDFQREQFAKHAASQYDKLVEQITAHTSKELKKSDAATTQSLLANGLTEVQNAPESADATVVDTKQRLVEYAQRAGWTPEVLKEKVAAHISDIHATAISALVQQGTPEAVAKAKTYLDAHRDELVGGQVGDADKLVDAGLLEGEAARQSDSILKTSIDAGAPQEGSSPTMTQALQRAGAIQDPKVRDATEKRIRQYFADLATAERYDRDAAYQRITQQIYKNGGRINRASPDYLKLSGSELETLEHAAETVRNPVQRGNPDKYKSLLNMATLNPHTKEEFMATPIDPTEFTPAQLGALLAARRRIEGDSTRTATKAKKEGEKAAAKAAHDQMIRDLMNGKKPTVPGAPIARPLGTSPTSPPLPPPAHDDEGGLDTSSVPQSWRDHAQENENYADYLRNMGVQVG